MSNKKDETQEKGVSNNAGWRGVSDALDRIPNFKESATRAEIHAVYHDWKGDQKEKAGNHEGAAAERARAQEQRDRSASKSPGRYRNPKD